MRPARRSRAKSSSPRPTWTWRCAAADPRLLRERRLRRRPHRLHGKTQAGLHRPLTACAIRRQREGDDMQSYWMQVSERRRGAGAARRAAARARARPGAAARCMPPRSTAASSSPAMACTAKPRRARQIGLEGAGEVVALGAGVTQLQAGRAGDGPLPRRFRAIRADGRARSHAACRTSLSWEEAAAIPLVYQVAYDLLVLQGRVARRRMGADQRRVVRRGRGQPADRQGLRRQGDRHLGLGRQAGAAGRAGPGRRAVHAGRRLPRRRDAGHRRRGASTWWSTTSAAPSLPRSCAAWHSRPAWAWSATSTACSRRRSTWGAACETPHAVRRLQQDAQRRAARRSRPRVHQ